ncbi:MAG: beta-galactosidase, partial [Clostridia bacterium]|nr:beta-galactosidase [Clostridia bacterium]
GFLSYYMFCGGTNFGFLNGGNEQTVAYDAPAGTPRKYIPMMTTYDADALVGEDGIPTEKYFACREVLLKNCPSLTPSEPLPANPEFQALGAVRLTEAARVLDQLDCLSSNVVESAAPLNMEAMGQNFGFVLYRTHVANTNNDKPHSLNIRSLRDRATIYENGKYRGTYMRERAYEPVQLLPGKDGVTLDILVENLGRTNFDRIIDRKGILGHVTLDDPCKLFGWTQYCLPFNDLSRVEYAPVDSVVIDDETPVLLRGTFDADETKDAFLHMKGFGKGNVWVNGFNLGRYWEIGPQETLFLPKDLLKKSGNVIEVLDLHHRDSLAVVEGIDHAILFGDPKNPPAYAPEYR